MFYKLSFTIIIFAITTQSCSIFKQKTVEDNSFEIIIEDDTTVIQNENNDESNDTIIEVIDTYEAIVNYESILLTDLVKKAKTENKLIMLMFGAEWCIPCHAFKDNTIKEKDINIYINEHYLVKYLDTETDFEGLELKPKYNIVNVPTFIFINSNNTEVDRIVGHLMGYSFLKKITEINEAN